MKSVRLLLLSLTISLPLAWSPAQVPESRSVNDVFVVPPGAVFGNHTDSTFFAIPRYRLERLLTDAILADSVQVLWKRDAERMNNEWLQVFSEKSFWKTTALIGGVVAIVELAIILIGS